MTSAGELSIMAGGAEEAVERAQPIFDVLGKATTYIGPAGAGQVAKAANQVVVALTIQAVAEALMLARKAGADPARVRDALLGGFAQSRILDLHGQRMLDGAFDPGFRLRLHRKDLAMRCNSAVRSTPRCSPPRRWRSSWTGCSLRAAGDRDHSALATLYEQLAGLTENAGVA